MRKIIETGWIPQALIVCKIFHTLSLAKFVTYYFR